MKNILFISLFFVSVATCAGTMVYAHHATGTRNTLGSESPSDTVRNIEAVTVTDRRIEKEIVPAQVLEGDELRRLGAVSTADAIRYFSGVQIKDYGGIGGLKTVDIRSLGSQHVGVFYDGVQLGNAQNGQVDLGRFSMDNMEAISVYNGQKSGILQSARDFASAGSVYLSSRRPTFAPGEHHNLRLSLKGGSFGTVNPAVLWEHRFGDKLDASFNAEYMYATGKYGFTYRKADGYDIRDVRRNGDVKALRVEGGLFGRLPQGDWRAKLYFYDSERGYPGAAVREEPGKFRNEDRQWDTDIFAQGSLRQHFGPYSLTINAKYSHDRLRYLSDPRLDITTMYVDNRYRQNEVYVSAANGLALKDRWQVSLSSDLQYNTLDADLADFVYPRRLTALVAAATALEFDKVQVQGSVLYSYVHDETRTAGGSAGDNNRWTPSVVAMYRPFSKIDFGVKAFYKRIFRMPTLNDLYYTFIGNAHLDPEFTTQYDLGAVYVEDFARGPLRRLEASLDCYFNNVENKIIAMPTSNQFRWTMLNLGYVEIRGVDASVKAGFRLGKVSLDTRVSYTFQKAQDFTDRGDPWYGGQIPYIPWHSGSCIVGAAWGGWDLNYSFIYTGERFESRANIPENHAQPWYTHDMSISKAIHAAGSEMRITAEINNILNQQYEVVQGYPMPGINFKLKLNWTL